MYDAIYEELEDPSFGDLLLSHLLSATSPRVQRSVLFSIVEAKHRKNRTTYNAELSRLAKKGFIKYDRETVMLKDREFVRKHLLPAHIARKANKDQQLLIIFDIPERIRGMRHWIRSQLKFWDFAMIQQSVWVGHGPIPEEFIKKLDEFGIKKHIRVFESTKMKEMKL